LRVTPRRGRSFQALCSIARLQAIPVAIVGAFLHARAEEIGEGRSLAMSEPRPRPHEQLKQALVEGRITAERVAQQLRIEPEDVPALAAGRVELTRYGWRRVLLCVQEGSG
jgi:hypothetical protein